MRGISDLVFDPFSFVAACSLVVADIQLSFGYHPRVRLRWSEPFAEYELCCRGEGAIDVSLSEGLAQIAVSTMDTAAPARQLLLGSSQRMGKEVEVLVDHGFGQLLVRSDE